MDYGGIEPINIAFDGTLTYNYWYDESGGTNFGSLCSTQSEKTNNTASLIEALKTSLEKLNELLNKKQAAGSL